MQEYRFYLEMLLDHQCSSSDGKCPECQSLQRIYQFMQTELFSTVIYTETSPHPRQSDRSPSQHFSRTAAGPRRPHAA